MASGTVVFQTAVTATPPNALAIMADSVNDIDHGAGTTQYIKIMDGATGGTLKAAVTANGLVVDTRGSILGTVQLHGTGQMLGTFQPLAGSVHLASGTVTVLGTIQVHGTAQALGTFQQHGTSQVIGTVQTHGTSQVIGTVQSHGTVDIGTVRFIVGTVHVGTVQRIQGGTIDSFGGTLGGGTVQTHGTSQVLGTVQPLAGSVHLATNLAGGTVVAVGSAVHGAVADNRPQLWGGFGSSGTQAAVDDGDAVRAWFDLNGRLQIRGTIDSMPAVNVATGTIPGGTVQLHGTSEILGTVRALTTVNAVIGTIQEGTINSFTGTAQVLGTIQALMTHGSVQGWQANGGAAAGNPVLWGGFGSSGTQAAVDDGDVVRAWFDLNGRQHVTGTLQPLAGSVHLATNLAGGTIVAVGSAIHGAAADARPLLMAAFGSSGTQAAVDDGDSTRLWADLNGRLQVRGTIDSIPSITIGAALPAGNNNIGDVDVASMPTVTVQATNLDIRDLTSASDSVAVVGSVSAQGYVAHDAAAAGNPVLVGAFGSSGTQAAVSDGDATRLWTDLNGRLQVFGTVGSITPIVVASGTVSLQTGGTAHIGSVQRLTGGTLDFIGGTVAVGTVRQVLGTVLMRPYQAGEGFFGTLFTGAGATNGTLVPAPASGTYVRVWDVVVSGSAAGTAFLELGNGTIFGPVFTAVNGGWSFNSAKGVRTNGTAQDILFNYSAGTWGVSVNYSLETL